MNIYGVTHIHSEGFSNGRESETFLAITKKEVEKWAYDRYSKAYKEAKTDEILDDLTNDKMLKQEFIDELWSSGFVWIQYIHSHEQFEVFIAELEVEKKGIVKKTKATRVAVKPTDTKVKKTKSTQAKTKTPTSKDVKSSSKVNAKVSAVPKDTKTGVNNKLDITSSKSTQKRGGVKASQVSSKSKTKPVDKTTPPKTVKRPTTTKTGSGKSTKEKSTTITEPKKTAVNKNTKKTTSQDKTKTLGDKPKRAKTKKNSDMDGQLSFF